MDLPYKHAASEGKNISLVLGSGGARGLTHIGVIEELTKRGYSIKAISGCSIGSLIGGVFAAGKLPQLKSWFIKMDKTQLFKLTDFTLTAQGFIKGERVIEELRNTLGDCNIEELPIPFTAVAADLHTGQEVWINKGSLFEAIRASAAVPTIVTPITIAGRELVDGGIVNPTPIEPVMKAGNDLIVVVNLNAKRHLTQPEVIHARSAKNYDLYVQKWLHTLPKMSAIREKFTYLGVINRMTEILQDKLTEYAIYNHKPDIVINISRNVCNSYEFYRAAELIELGKKSCIMAMDSYDEMKKQKTDLNTIKSVLWNLLPFDYILGNEKKK
ncbi:MAG TPA: patatin-like phospholipase family protein [Chitinophagales bacterium]|nr:patatin-like phospholipase family protein [Chitinophagales bacterium]HRK27034.1 patatin-like phospholipase family protein [Chitinophagales bacterium]